MPDPPDDPTGTNDTQSAGTPGNPNINDMQTKQEAGAPGNDTENTGSTPWQEMLETTTPTTASQAPKPDIFADLGAFAVDPGDATPSERVLVTLSVRKPKETEWVQASATIRARLNLVADKDNNALYLIHASLLDEVRDLVTVKPVLLVLTVSTNGTAFVWPVTIPADHRPNLWHATGLQALEHATRTWTRVRSDVTAGQYEIRRRKVDDGTAPVWPAEIDTPNEMCRVTFNGRAGADAITDRNHIFLKRLRGEA